MRVPPGTRLGHYEILAAIGAGGMGEVYRARDTRLQRPAAIKVITADDGDADRVRRLEHEALSASALNHPNILTVYEFGVHDGLQYIATELVEGETLRDRIRAGRTPLIPALDIALQIGAALDAAHAAGIVHRDVKPENVMVRPDGYVKVLDFGIAKLIPSSAAAADSNTLTVQTVPGMLLGTVGYMAPEQIRGLPVDHRADVWSFGVVLHELLSGRSPFAGPTTSDVIAAVLERNPPSLAMSGVDVPPELERIIAKTLAKNRNDRYQSMKDLLIDVRQLRSPPSGSITTAPAPPRRFMARAIPMSLLGVVAAAWIGWSWLQPSIPNESAAPPGATSTPSVLPTQTFRYWLSVQSVKNGVVVDEVDSPGTGIFSRSSRFRFNFSNPQPGFVYVLNEAGGSRGEPLLTALYPTPSIRGGSAEMRAGDVVSTGWFFFDQKAPLERVWIVWSREPQPQLEQAKRWVTQEHRGLVKDAAEVAALQGLLSSPGAKDTTARVDDGSKQMVVSGRGDLLVHKAELRTR